MFVDTWNIQCMLKLGEYSEDKDQTKNDAQEKAIGMPGDVCRGLIYLRKPMVVKEGQRFFVRETNLTTVTGVITKVGVCGV